MTWIFCIVICFVIMLTILRIITHHLSKEDNLSSLRNNSERLATFKKIVPKIYLGFVALVLIFTMCSSVYMTNEQQIGFVSTFGNTSMIEGAGIHFKLPFVSSKYVYDATTQGMAIGYNESSDESQEEDSLMITSDFNFVNIDFYIEYRISDPVEYHFGSNDPEGVLKNIAQSAIRNTVGQYEVDSVLTTGKAEIEIAVRDDITKELEYHNTGLTIMNVTIQDSEPPTADVAAAFTNVENAKQNAESVINKANEYANTQLPAAEAQAEAVKQAANATKTERVNEASEQIARFNALFKAYKENPDSVRTMLYYETLEEILPNMDIVVSDDAKIVYVTGNTTDAEAATVAATDN